MKKALLFLLLVTGLAPFNANAQLGRWYNYDDYVAHKATGMGDIYEFYSNYMWHDTASKDYYAAGYARNHFTSMGLSFAPRLAAWDDPVLYGSSIKVGPTDAFVIDSVRVAGTYMRNNLITGPTDTLRLSFVYGNGGATSNMPGINFTTPHYGSTDVIDILYDSVNNLAGQNPASSVSPYVIYITLHNTDTATNWYRTITLPTPFSVPAGNCAAASLSFKSGDPSYFAGDTVAYASGNYKHGMFMPWTIAYSTAPAALDWAPFDAADSNMGYFEYGPQGAWSGYYGPQWLWASSGLPSALQAPAIEFHIKCPTCRLNEDISAASTEVCVGSTITLSHGLAGGTWSSSATSVATVGAGTGIVSGAGEGTATITYNVSGNFTTTVITVNGLPAVGTIGGSGTVCEGSSTLLSPTVLGGTWSSASPAIGSVSSVGVVTGIAPGTAVISYTTANACGDSHTTRIITVNPLPVAGTISGPSGLCVGSTITLSASVPGGTWSSVGGFTTISSSGVVTGIALGVDVISYTVSNSCGMAVATASVTATLLLAAGSLSGASTVCPGGAITLMPTVSGGSWSASNGNATVSATGDVTGVTAGTVDISYTVSNACGSTSAVQAVTVNPVTDPGTLSGAASVCIGASIILTPSVTSGGSWSASNGNATVSATGDVTGVTAGPVNISYTLSTICGPVSAVKAVTVSDCPEGVDGLAAAQVVAIYPNPAHDNIVITSQQDIKGVVISNMVGQEVFSASYNAKNIVISVAQLPQGIYTIRVNGANVYKIVKQ